MDAATAGLEEIKALLASNPILAAPNIGEPMLLYIASTHQVVSAVLVVKREEDGHKFPLQKPVYYVSTVLTPCKSRYPHYQKIAMGRIAKWAIKLLPFDIIYKPRWAIKSRMLSFDNVGTVTCMV